ncbi:MAG TPA: hypothetical protein VLV85_17085, partial [Stellaceae bacterium]|nr:hypothetical protein [Stellaceae bacterium]
WLSAAAISARRAITAASGVGMRMGRLLATLPLPAGEGIAYLSNRAGAAKKKPRPEGRGLVGRREFGALSPGGP